MGIIFNFLMNALKKNFFIFLFILVTSSAYTQNQKDILTAEQAISDLNWLEKFISDVHIAPKALYEGNDLTKSFFNLKTKIIKTGSISKSKLYAELLPVLYTIQDIHLSLYLPSTENDYLNSDNYYLILQIKILNDDNIYCLDSDKKIIPRGSRILSINGYTDYEIMSKLMSASPSDGKNSHSKSLFSEKNFVELFPLYFPVLSQNQMRYIPPNSADTFSIHYPGEKKARNIKNYLRKSEDKRSPNYHEIFFFHNPEAAMIRIPSFSEESTKGFKDFLDYIFNTIHEKNIEHLIIDLRGNEGGYAEQGEILLSYLISYKTPYINNIIYKHSRMADEIYDKQSKNSPLLKRMFVLRELIKMKDEPYGTYDTLIYAQTEPHAQVYKGKLYILVNGLSVSTTGLVCNALREHRGAVFIGQQGGFTPEGTFGQVIGFKLPFSKIMGAMSTIRFNSTDSFSIGTNPFLPDIQVDETIDDILKGKDPVLEQTLEIIRKKQA